LDFTVKIYARKFLAARCRLSLMVVHVINLTISLMIDLCFPYYFTMQYLEDEKCMRHRDDEKAPRQL